MTGADHKTQVENLLAGETVEESFFYQILNIARVTLEGSRNWRKLIALDETETTTSSDTYLTLRDLPANFLKAFKMYVDEREYDEIGIEERYVKRDTSGFFYIDHANDKYALCGPQVGGETIRFAFINDSGDITSGTSWSFPSTYHPVLSLDTARLIVEGPEYDDVNINMTPGQERAFEGLRKAMVAWDAQLHLSAMNFSRSARPITRGDNQIWDFNN